MKKRLDNANQQLIGYRYGVWQDIVGLIKAMGVTEKEWNTLKKDYEPNLSEREFEDIEEHFASSHKEKHLKNKSL